MVFFIGNGVIHGLGLVVHFIALSSFTQAFARAIKVERMIGYFKIQYLSGHVLNVLNARIAEFENLTAVLANEVVMLSVLVRPLELCYVFAELMLGYQFTIEE